MELTVKYSYRAYPTPEQKTHLNSAFGAMRFVKNHYIEQREAKHRGEITEVVTLDKFGKLDPNHSWLKKHSQKMAEQAVRQTDTAYKNFFDGLAGRRKDKPGKPRFKKKGECDSLTWNGPSLQVKKLNRKWSAVLIPKGPRGGEWLKFKVSRQLPSKPTGVTLKLSKAGVYQLSFTVKVKTAAKKRTSGPVAGVDLGLKDLATVVSTDGTASSRYKVAAPQFEREAHAKTAKLQRALARKQKGSKNRAKAKLALAKHHQRVADRRRDLNRKLALKLASENQAVIFEGLAVAAMAKRKKGWRFGRSIHDAGWSQLRGFVGEACAKMGSTTVELSRYQATTQPCGACGWPGAGAVDLSVREWSCPQCSTTLDRDYNAALNILLLGAGQALVSCGGDVRRQLATPEAAAPAKQQPPPGRRGLAPGSPV